MLKRPAALALAMSLGCTASTLPSTPSAPDVTTAPGLPTEASVRTSATASAMASAAPPGATEPACRPAGYLREARTGNRALELCVAFAAGKEERVKCVHVDFSTKKTTAIATTTLPVDPRAESSVRVETTPTDVTVCRDDSLPCTTIRPSGYTPTQANIVASTNTDGSLLVVELTRQGQRATFGTYRVDGGGKKLATVRSIAQFDWSCGGARFQGDTLYLDGASCIGATEEYRRPWFANATSGKLIAAVGGKDMKVHYENPDQPLPVMGDLWAVPRDGDVLFQNAISGAIGARGKLSTLATDGFERMLPSTSGLIVVWGGGAALFDPQTGTSEVVPIPTCEP